MASQDLRSSYSTDTPVIVRRDERHPADLNLPRLRLADILLHAGLSDDLEQVEARLIERSRSRSPQITAAGLHTIRSGGKRLRAALALLAASLGDYALPQVLHAAAAAELIHAASLVHDDLVDDADQRRSHTTVHVRWNSDVALMVGDYFFALAAGEMALAPDPRVISIYAQAVQTIVEGELSPVLVVEPLDKALDQYLYKTSAKTAALFEAACKAGMICGRGGDEQIAALGRYGSDLGIAFQIIDDILDYSGTQHTLGKPAGNDLRQGTITLPLIYAVANGASRSLIDLLDAPALDDAQVELALDEVVRWGGVASAQAVAERYARRAQAQLALFAPSSARSALQAICQFVVDRSS